MHSRRRHFLALYLVLVFTGGSTRVAAEDGPLLVPLFRFARYSDRDPVSEYVGNEKNPYFENFRNLPRAAGPMQVDCRTIKSIGIVFDPVDVGHWIYGTNTKYRFRWTHSTEYPKQRSYMVYQSNAPYGFIRSSIKLKRWLADGIVHLSIDVGETTVFQTDYRLFNCEVNLYRGSESPSEKRKAQEREEMVPDR